jgi:hypothetical protein
MTLITKEQTLLEQWRSLPEEQQTALDFIAFLQQKSTPKRPLKSSLGLWKDLQVDITEEDIAEARKEMWGNFPRDIEL